MVIDVIGSLFDQILSDPRVPPQMARQIARLQLPVLRVAMNDASFFSSRRHPVRRFVNRIASLGCAFRRLRRPGPAGCSTGPPAGAGQIVEATSTRSSCTSDKLAELELFIVDQTQGKGAADARRGHAGPRKESEPAHAAALHAAAGGRAQADHAAAGYLRDFVSQVWTRRWCWRCGATAPRRTATSAYKRAGRDLIMSVQPGLADAAQSS